MKTILRSISRALRLSGEIGIRLGARLKTIGDGLVAWATKRSNDG